MLQDTWPLFRKVKVMKDKETLRNLRDEGDTTATGNMVSCIGFNNRRKNINGKTRETWIKSSLVNTIVPVLTS